MSDRKRDYIHADSADGLSRVPVTKSHKVIKCRFCGRPFVRFTTAGKLDWNRVHRNCAPTRFGGIADFPRAPQSS